MTAPDHRHAARFAAAALGALLLAGCAALTPTATPQPASSYALDGARAAAPAPRAAPAGAPVVVVNETQAAAGYDSQRIVYVRQPHQLEYFAHHEWVDPPARMLTPLIVGALKASGAFRATVSAPGPASGDLRLETQLLLLQHEFGTAPSQVRFGLRAYLAEDATRRVVATRDFEALAPAPADGPYGGVRAANAAVRKVLDELAAFCTETAAAWVPGRANGR